MQKSIVAFLLVIAMAVVTAPSASADTIKKTPLQADEILELASQEVASAEDIEDVDAGIFGMVNSLLGLAVTAGLAYLIWKNLDDDD